MWKLCDLILFEETTFLKLVIHSPAKPNWNKHLYYGKHKSRTSDFFVRNYFEIMIK